MYSKSLPLNILYGTFVPRSIVVSLANIHPMSMANVILLFFGKFTGKYFLSVLQKHGKILGKITAKT